MRAGEGERVSGPAEGGEENPGFAEAATTAPASHEEFAAEAEAHHDWAPAPAPDAAGEAPPPALEAEASAPSWSAPVEASAPAPHAGDDAETVAEAADEPSASHEEEDEEEDDDHEVTTLDGGAEQPAPRARHARHDEEGEVEAVESIGGDAMEEMPRRPPRLRRQYKIQEVIKRRQVLLVQVVKEERGNKGAALTTYLSLAGRYSVLMPNTARGGGISRKITNSMDRSRLKTIAQDLEVPEGMGVILRTAGASRTKAEVKRDFEYLLRMWETVRELTLSSSAPTLVYEEGSLIKRAIRDLYNKDVEEIVVAGEDAYREAKDFMRLLMPSQVRNVVPYRDVQPVFARVGVEAQLDAMFSNQVTLKSGGYIVINQTEALVAIDVNSGRSTREHNIEDTALRTNLEAADEVARQLRLRDLAGLIVVDFIDMEEGRNNRAVERRVKDALKNDRARIQVGRISHFGLLEMSRQRIRTGVLEGSTVVCAHCMGSGVVRSTASVALHVLRVLEDALIKSASHNMIVRSRTEVALYILNQKRAHLRDLERRFGVSIVLAADDTLTGVNYHAFERGEPATGVRAEDLALDASRRDHAEPVEEDVEDEIPVEEDEDAEGEEAVSGETEEETADRAGRHGPRAEKAGEEGEAGRRRRRRRRRRGGERAPIEEFNPDAPQPNDSGLAAIAEIGGDLAAPAGDDPAEEGEVSDDGRPRGLPGRQRRARGARRGDRGRGPRFPASPGDGTPEADVAEAADAPDHVAEAEAPLAEAATAAPSSAREEGHGWTRVSEPEAEAPIREAAAWAPVAAETPDYGAATPVSEPKSAAQQPATEGSPAAPEPVAEAASARVAEVEDPSRPKRSGWWRRARATFAGE